MRIAIDYGHGGSDSGAVANGVYEKNINKLVGERVKYHLERHGQTVILTRHNDEYVSLDERVNIINRNNCDIGISLHCNSFSNPSAQGVEIYTWGNGSRETLLAKKVLDNIISAKLYTKNRGMKQEQFRVLSPQIPICLLEMGFISNLQDKNLIMNNIENFAIAITKGLLEFDNISYKAENKESILGEGLYRVQVGAYKDIKNANDMKAKLKSLGIESYIKKY